LTITTITTFSTNPQSIITRADKHLTSRENTAVLALIRYKLGVIKQYPDGFMRWATQERPNGSEGSPNMTWVPADKSYQDGRKQAIKLAAEHYMAAIIAAAAE
jgi:hypothetical protein